MQDGEAVTNHGEGACVHACVRARMAGLVDGTHIPALLRRAWLALDDVARHLVQEDGGARYGLSNAIDRAWLEADNARLRGWLEHIRDQAPYPDAMLCLRALAGGPVPAPVDHEAR